MLNKTICFVGAGSMAEAIIAGVLKKKTINPDRITVVNKSNHVRLQQLTSKYGIIADPDQKAQLIKKADILILAMKPKDVISSLQEIHLYTSNTQLIISVVAGLSTSMITNLLGHTAPVIRTMPNTSAKIGLSATAIAPGKYAHETDLETARSILESIGQVYLVKEEQLDAVTGLSGSGPAYIYYLVEAMIKGGMDVGLSEEQAYQLTVQTVLGAAMMLKESGDHPSTLREQVTSPNGTTAKGLETLRSYRFEEAVRQCIQQAAKRSKELGEQLQG
jgi:pyrroline-5-carboxylate reductase